MDRGFSILLKQIRKDRRGQSLIEFLFSITFVICFVFIFLKLALNMTNGYLVHYATFMASRSYLVYDNQQGQGQLASMDAAALEASRKVFSKYVLFSSSKNLTANHPGDNSVKAIFVGLYYSYEPYFAMSNLVAGKKTVNLLSESFLGREPPMYDCQERIMSAMDEAADGVDYQSNVTYFDDGC